MPHQDCRLSWVELAGVGLARLQFWLQNADFGLEGKKVIAVSCDSKVPMVGLEPTRA